MNIKNYEYLRFLNPFDTMFWVDFDILFPEPSEPEGEEKPDFDYDDFVKIYGVEFLGYIEPGKTLHPLFLAFKSIAINLVSFDLVGQDEELWKLLVSLHIGHNMEMAMSRLKNQADEISMTPEKPKEKKLEYNIERPESMSEQFQKTKYGMAFWQSYYPYLRFRHWGLYTNRGFNK